MIGTISTGWIDHFKLAYLMILKPGLDVAISPAWNALQMDGLSSVLTASVTFDATEIRRLKSSLKERQISSHILKTIYLTILQNYLNLHLS